MSYVGIGTSDPNHPLEVEGQVFVSNVEQGSTTNLVPFEVHSDYTGITGSILTGARQMRLRVTPSATTTSNVNIDMGIEPTSGSYFYISNPVVDTALGSNTALRIVQAGHVEVGSNLSVSGNVVASNIIGGSPLTLSSDTLVKVAGSGGLSVTGPLNVDGGGTINGTSATYTGLVQAGSVSSTGGITSDGTLSASPNVAKTHILGKAKVGGTGGAARFGQYDFFDDGVSWALSQGAAGTTYINRPTGQDIYFREADTTAHMIIKSGGNIGVGTNTPTQKFEVKDGNIAIGQGYSFVGLRVDDSIAGSITSNNEGWTIEESRGGSTTSIQVGGNDIIFSTGTPDERMRILSTGNVGIGTATPGAKLDVSGDIQGTNLTASGTLSAAGITSSAAVNVTGTISSSDDIKAVDVSITNDLIHTGDTDTRLQFDTNQITLRAGGTDVHTVTSGGVAVTGTVSSSGDMSAQDMTISGSLFHSGDTDTYLTFGTNQVDLNAGGGRRLRADSTGIAIGTSSAAVQLHINGDLDDALRIQNISRDDWFDLSCNNQNNLNIRNDANIGVKLDNDDTSWTVASDERIKKNITILENNIEKISNIRAVSYHYNNDDDSRQKRIGFIAQDWINVQPEVISTSDPNEYGIKYTETIPVLCGAIQELVARVAALENR